MTALLFVAAGSLVVLAIPIFVGLCALVALEWMCDAVNAALRSSGAVFGDVLDPDVLA